MFTYEASQAETNHDAPETSIIVRHASYAPAYTTVNMDSEASSVVDTVLEGSNTLGDLIRGIWAVVGGLSGDYTNPPYTFKDPATGTVTRLTVTADATGRTVVVVGDLT
jgi:hypothetical protein